MPTKVACRGTSWGGRYGTSPRDRNPQCPAKTCRVKVLVTGGAGFIGSNFVRYWLLHHPEDDVVNLDKLTYAGNLANLKDVAASPRYSFLRGDICDPDVVSQAMRGVDVVVHFAAESHVDRSILN